MDFLIQFTQKQHTFDLLEQAAWSLDNILRLIKNLSYEEVTKLVILLYFQIQIILRALCYITEDFDPAIYGHECKFYKDKIARNICSGMRVIAVDNSNHIDQILESSLKPLLEFCMTCKFIIRYIT